MRLRRQLLHANAHKGLANGPSDRLGLAFRHSPIEIDLHRTEIAAGCYQQRADESIIGFILFEKRANTALISIDRIGPQVNGELRLHPERITPLHGPVIKEALAEEQLIDQLSILVRALVFNKILSLFHGRQTPPERQIDAPDIDRVGGHIRHDTALVFPAGDHRAICTRDINNLRRAFKWRYRLTRP